MEPLVLMHSAQMWMLLAFLFPCILLPMFFLSKRLPVLVPDGHANTKWIDGLRGVAASSVALNHAPFMLGSLAIMPKVFYVGAEGATAPILFGALGVQIFFCITGLLFTGKILSAQSIDWSDFYKKRMRRVMPAYVMAATAALLVAAWFSWPVTQDTVSILRALPGVYGFGLLPMPVINEFDFSRILGVAWSLGIEWRFYFFLPIIFLAARKNRNVTFAVITVFALFDLAMTGISTWSFFIPGALCSLIASKAFSKNVRLTAGFVALATLVFIFYRAGDKTNYGLEQWLCVSVLFAALTISRPTILTLRTLVAMGSVSYSFYLLHCMVLTIVFGVFNYYWLDIAALSLVGFAVFTGCTLAFASVLATASFVFIEHRYMHKPPASTSLSRPVVAPPVLVP